MLHASHEMLISRCVLPGLKHRNLRPKIPRGRQLESGDSSRSSRLARCVLETGHGDIGHGLSLYVPLALYPNACQRKDRMHRDTWPYTGQHPMRDTTHYGRRGSGHHQGKHALGANQWRPERLQASDEDSEPTGFAARFMRVCAILNLSGRGARSS